MTLKIPKEEARLLKILENNLSNQIIELDSYPYYFITVTYTVRNKTPLELENLKRLNHISATHRLIRRKLKEHFKVEMVQMFQEKHQGYQQKWYGGDKITDREIENLLLSLNNIQSDEMVNNGRYHSNIIISSMDIESLLEPPRSSRIGKLLKKQSNHFGVPIVNCFPYHNDDYLVEDLLNACIREIDDVDSNYGKAVNVEVIEDAENIRNKVHYCLKDCRNQGTDFTQIIDFANSDFLKEEL